MEMQNSDKLIQTLYDAIDEVNELLPQPGRIKKSLETIFWGTLSNVDSLTIINLIVSIEEKIVENFGVTLNLSELLFSSDHPPETLGNLNTEIAKYLDEGSNGR